MGVPATKQRSACRVRARPAWPGGVRHALGTLLLACGFGACVRAPALIVGARSTLGTADRKPLRIVTFCALDWSRPMRTAEPIGIDREVAIELDESATAESACMIASLCEWEARAGRAALSRTLAALPEAAP